MALEASLAQEKNKKAVFARLDALEEDDEKDDIGLRESMAFFGRKTCNEVKEPACRKSLQPITAVQVESTVHVALRKAGASDGIVARTLKRAFTVPEQITATAIPQKIAAHAVPQPAVPVLRHAVSNPTAGVPSLIRGTSAPMSSLGKRSRSGGPEMVPESERIFAGLQFCRSYSLRT